MNSQEIGTKPFVERMNVQSGEATASIPAGTPVLLIMNGTGDGFNVKLPSSGSALLVSAFQNGVVDRTMAPNDYGIAQVYGWCNRSIVVQQSRASSTNNYATAAALSIGQPLSIDTVNNAFAIFVQATGGATVVTATSAASSDTISFNFGNGVPAMAFLAQTLASAASSASTSSDSSVAKTYALKCFLRMM